MKKEERGTDEEQTRKDLLGFAVAYSVTSFSRRG